MLRPASAVPAPANVLPGRAGHLGVGENRGKGGGRYALWAQSTPGAPSGEGRARPGLGGWGMGASPFNVILFRLVGLVGCLDVVPLAHHCDVTLHVAL